MVEHVRTASLVQETRHPISVRTLPRRTNSHNPVSHAGRVNCKLASSICQVIASPVVSRDDARKMNRDREAPRLQAEKMVADRARIAVAKRKRKNCSQVGDGRTSGRHWSLRRGLHRSAALDTVDVVTCLLVLCLESVPRSMRDPRVQAVAPKYGYGHASNEPRKQRTNP